ncbi:right-handed parallel beta-helix repeat-containing protein [Paenibacillus oceani]|uniref:Right-handed parallel beta-helix repeat-containing protein n=1 Tax=Paenibacillus oceani TaxID=2772510 RepID=A0A927GZZ9_9BACL|nr:right-handed parallel beta-helix repeat-containing protein [Paenibacillus oceani]MBD2863180.1 right-handed parallel beta-helix repeat-containing protein [Paenibacillus oceani]
MADNRVSRRQMLAAMGVAGAASVGFLYGRPAESHASVIESVYLESKKKPKISVVEPVLCFHDMMSLIGYTGAHDGQQVSLIEYRQGSGTGGGLLYWDPAMPKSAHNGGTVFSPTAGWDGTAAGLPSFLSGSGETNPSGSGCWVRVKEREHEFVPENFGAIGQGNEQVIVQSVLDAAKAWSDQQAGRRPVIVFDRLYTVNGIQVYDGFVLLGPGGFKRDDGVIPSSAVASNSVVLGNGIKDIDIIGLHVDGNEQMQGVMSDPVYRQGSNAGALGYQNIYIIGKYANADHEMGTIRIQNCRLVHSPGNGIVVNNHSQASLTGNHIERCGKNGIYLAQTHGFNTSVTGNYIRECGFVYGGGIGIAHAHVNATGNVIVSCYEYGILISSTGVGARWNTDITVASNNIRGVKRQLLDNSGDPDSFKTSSLGVGIGYTQVFVTRASTRLNVAITGNSIEGAEGSGIACMGAAYNAGFLPHGLVVSANSILLCGGAGLNIRYLRGVSCIGNRVAANFFADLYLDDVAGSVSGNTVVCRYPVSDRVVYQGIKYEAKKRHLSSGETKPGVNADCWTVIQTSETLPEWHTDEVYSPAVRPSTYAIYSVHRPSGTAVSGKRNDLLLEHNQVEGADNSNRLSNVNLVRKLAGGGLPTELPVRAGDRIYYDTPASGGREGRICITKGIDTAAIAWAGGQAVSAGERRTAAGNVYEAVQAGTTGTAAPAHTSGSASDGAVVWSFIDTVAVFEEFGKIGV